MNEPAIRVGVIGLGFMGQTHLRAYESAHRHGHPVEIRAICDANTTRLEETSKRLAKAIAEEGSPRGRSTPICAHTADELLLDPSIDAVSICTPTPSHVPLACRAIEHGKHVLVEKPVSTSVVECERLVRVASASDRLVMPAMCMRFWSEWAWLHRAVHGAEFGPVRSAVFRRVGSFPNWSEFYADHESSGGVLFDLHVHDADFVCWLFGAPRRVATTGSLNHLTTQYDFGPQGPSHVTAEGSWGRSPGAGFRMQFSVEFERATAEFDLGADPPLSLWVGDAPQDARHAPIDGWEGEIAAFLEAISSNASQPPVALDDAVRVTRVLDAESRSLVSGNWQAVEPD